MRMKAGTIHIRRLDGRNIPATIVTNQPQLSQVCMLAHGIFVTRSENGRFDRLSERLANSGIASIRMDLSGHGQSEIPSLQSTVASMADDIAYTYYYLRGEGVENIQIVASSFAAALLSILCGTTYGPQFSRIVLLNPVLDFDNAFVHAEMPEMAEMFSPNSIALAFSTGSFLPVPHFQMSRGFLVELMSIDVQKAYEQLVTPHLVVHGTADELISYKHTRNIVRSNSHATFETVEGAKHAFNTEQAEKKAHALTLAWLLAT